MSLPELPEPDRTMWQHGKQIDHYTADQMRAYALQAVEALRPVAMTDGQIRALWWGIDGAASKPFMEALTRFARAVESNHRIGTANTTSTNNRN